MVIVEYRCVECRQRSERWMDTPIPALAQCRSCGSPAKRRFGGTFVGAQSSERPAASRTGPAPSTGAGCADHSGVPGGCVLTPTAARALSARIRGDNRALEKELAYQEAGVADGSIDRTRPPVLPSSAHNAPIQKEGESS